MTVRVAISLAVAAALLGTGCSTAPIVLRGDDLRGVPEPPRTRDPARPLVVFEPTVDARGADQAGTLAGRAVSITHVQPWLDDELVHIASPAFDVAPSGDPAASASSAPVLRVRPRLLKAYVQSLSTSKSAVVVLEASYVGPDGATTVRNYRGQQVGMNWASGTGETIAAFRDALAACVQQIQADMQRFVEPK